MRRLLIITLLLATVTACASVRNHAVEMVAPPEIVRESGWWACVLWYVGPGH